MIEAVAAARLGQKGLARRLFNEIIEKDPHSEQALLWLAALADTPDESIRALEQVLLINPNNEQATKALEVQKMHQVAKPTEVPLPPPTTRALPAGPFQSPSRMQRRNAAADAAAREMASVLREEGNAAPGAPPPHYQRAIRRVYHCPICEAEHLNLPDRCNHCGCFLSLDDPARIAENRGVDEELLLRAIAAWQAKLPFEPLTANVNLGRALLSLNRSAEALLHLSAATELEPGNSELRNITDMLRARKLIVAVDDSLTVRKLVSVHLERRGYRVLALDDGLAALSKLEEFRPDLILLDISLPKVDGYEICKLLRKHSELKKVPVIMLSGRDGFWDRLRGRMAGATEYITKPFEISTLAQVLARHLQR